ncbi:MAG: hypothetical protein ACE366_11660 [Bradymonadia bacterium]
MSRQVMVATDEAQLALEMGRLEPSYAQFVVCSDGLECLEGVTAALKARTPLALTVLDLSQMRPEAWATGQMIRAVEAGFEAEPCPILVLSAYPAGPETEQRLAHLGRAVYLQKTEGQSAMALARTLSVAVERLVGGAA